MHVARWNEEKRGVQFMYRVYPTERYTTEKRGTWKKVRWPHTMHKCEQAKKVSGQVHFGIETKANVALLFPCACLQHIPTAISSVLLRSNIILWCWLRNELTLNSSACCIAEQPKKKICLNKFAVKFRIRKKQKFQIKPKLVHAQNNHMYICIYTY